MMYVLIIIAGGILGGMMVAIVLYPKLTSVRAMRDSLQTQLLELQNSSTAQAQSENKILMELVPVNRTITEMQNKIAAFEKDRSEQYGKLEAVLNSSINQQKDLFNTTTSLANALKSNQTRGQWGEAQLRRIVEATGMMGHVTFDMQVTTGAKRPDMVIHLPENKIIVIDAKAPANNYLDACAISDLSDERELQRKKELISEHVKDMRNHINALSKKEYWSDFESPDFTIMFIPNEAMLSAALEAAPTLLEYSFQNHIALASPVSLFSVLKTVSFVWQQQSLSDNAKQLGELSLELLNRINVVAKHSSELAKALGVAVEKYNHFAVSLESNMLTQANKIAQHMERSEIDLPKKLKFEAHEWRKEELLIKD